jgi:hypothetical protein
MSGVTIFGTFECNFNKIIHGSLPICDAIDSFAVRYEGCHLIPWLTLRGALHHAPYTL